MDDIPIYQSAYIPSLYHDWSTERQMLKYELLNGDSNRIYLRQQQEQDFNNCQASDC